MQLPLTSRELVRQARRRGMYRTRTIAPILSSVALAWFVFVDRHERPETIGAICHFFALVTQYAVIGLIAPALAAETITHEKRHRTLALLVLANSRGHDIVASKFSAVMLSTQLLLVSTLPLLAFATFFGGVQLELALTHTLLNALTLTGFIALGILVSTISDDARNALWTLYALLALWTLGGYSLGQLYPQSHWAWWKSPDGDIIPLAVTTFGLAVASLALATLLIPRQVYHEHTRARRLPRVAKPLTARPGLPLYHLVRRCAHVDYLGGHATVRVALWLGMLAASWYLGFLVWPLLLLLAAHHTAATIEQLTATGALDDIRLASSQGWELADAVHSRQMIASLLLLPAFAVGSLRLALRFDPLYAAMIIVAASVLGFALLRLVVSLACDLWQPGRPAASVALKAMGKVVGTMLIACVGAWIVYLCVTVFIYWFRLEQFPLLAAPATIAAVTFWLVVSAYGASRDPRLRFRHQFERELRETR